MDKKEKTNATATRPCGERYLPLESSKDLSMGSGFVFVFLFKCGFYRYLPHFGTGNCHFNGIVCNFLEFEPLIFHGIMVYLHIFALFWCSNCSFCKVF